jgi:hypothetical protein
MLAERVGSSLWMIGLMVVAVGAGSASVARADGLVRSLPEDGTWVKYNVRMQANDATITGSVRVASVGKGFTEAGACRWIEVRVETTGPAEGTVSARAKFLVPETAVMRGKDPTTLLEKKWLKMGDEALRDLKVEPFEPVDQLLKLFAGPPLIGAEALPAVAVANKLGNLDCPGETGKTELVALGAKLKPQIDARWNDKVPFGTVDYRMEFNAVLPGDNKLDVTIHLTYEDSGDGAVSELPDAQ